MFGITLCELFSHDEPYGSKVDITAKQVCDDEKRPDKIPVEQCPNAVWDVVKSCVVEDPNKRPSMEKVLRSLTLVLEDERKHHAQLQQQQANEEKRKQQEHEAEFNRVKGALDTITAENDALKRDIEAKSAAIDENKKLIDVKDRDIQAKGAAIEAKDQEIKQLSAESATKSREVQQVSELSAKQLTEAKEEIRKLKEEIKKVQQPVVSPRPQSPPAPQLEIEIQDLVERLSGVFSRFCIILYQQITV